MGFATGSANGFRETSERMLFHYPRMLFHARDADIVSTLFEPPVTTQNNIAFELKPIHQIICFFN